MKKVVALLSGCLLALAAVASNSSTSQIFQLRLVLDKPSDDTERMVFAHKVGDRSEDETLYVQKKVLFDQTALTSAKVMTDPLGQPQIQITFTKAGGRQFAELTRNNINKRLAIIVDGHIYSAPIIRTEISNGKAEISGTFSKQEADQLASKIKESLAK